MGKLADLPSTVLQLILSCLDMKDAFRCSSLSRCFHTAASYYFYSEYVKENWSLPLSPTAILDFFMMKSRQLWTGEIAGETRLDRLQNVKRVAYGHRFVAFATHKREIVLVRGEEVRVKVKVGLPIEDVCAGVGVVGVLLRGGSALFLEVMEASAVPYPVTVPSVVTCMACYHSALVVATAACQVFSYRPGSVQEFTFSPVVAQTPVVDLQCRSKAVLILFQGGKLYKAENGGVNAAIDPYFRNKRIAVVAAGLLHYLALQRDDTLELATWSSEKVAEWMGESGFGDCVSVISSSKITGKDLHSATDAFLTDILEIQEPERRSRLQVLLQSVKDRRVAAHSTLLAWGKNTDSQLGCSKAVVSTPIAVALPMLRTNEYVRALYCAKMHSLVYTSESRVFALGGVRFKGRTDGEEVQWRDLTQRLNQNDAKRVVEELFVGSYEFHFLMLKRPVSALRRKRGNNSSSVVNQLMWDPSLHLTDFVVGCEDKSGAVTERSAEHLVQHEGLKIRYVKRGGEVVWESTAKSRDSK